MLEMDETTRKWLRNASDEVAVDNGCKFDEPRGQEVVNWIERNCVLYEGECAGQPMLLKDWQYEVIMRLFGWVRYSERWGRWVRRFTSASIWVPKKNGKSPTLAAIGLYLLCGDGEQGQKVYFGAKDGAQAREIAAKHAFEMVLHSEAFRAECTINRNLMQVTHEPTRSLLKPLSSGSDRTQQAKEGLNGSILIDETHVVDRAFINRVKRAGISRSEPLHIEVSTAGSDPEGYGKQRYDYGKRVEVGEVNNERLLFAAWEAPQELTDVELAEDPSKWGKMANPAWGRIIGEEEYLADYNESCATPSELNEFKMYRLNLWQRSSSPWIAAASWDRCATEFTLDKLAGRRAWAGLDLSRTRDMSALVLVVEGDGDDDKYVLPYFWLPEAEAERHRKDASFEQWATDGFLTLTPGDVVDYAYIKKTFRELATKLKILELIYDPLYAEELTQSLAEGTRDASGKVIEAGTGVVRVAFKQTIVHFAGPMAEAERLILAGALHHADHPVMTWQMGHVTVWRDINSNVRPVKPKRGDVRKIDGVVAMVMALARAMVDEPAPAPSVYQSRGILRV